MTKYIAVVGRESFGKWDIWPGRKHAERRNTEYHFIRDTLDKEFNPDDEPLPTKDVTLILSNKGGVAASVEMWAISNWVPYEVMEMNWEHFGMGTEKARNWKMLGENENGDVKLGEVLVLGPRDKHTDHLCTLARLYGLPVRRFEMEAEADA